VTIAGNTDTGKAGALYNDTSATATLTNVTISSNSGGGIKNNNTSINFTVANTIVAGNTIVGQTSGQDVAGAFNSLGYNLVGIVDGSTGSNGFDLTGTAANPLNANLGPLANNGGLTQTMLPQAGSLALGTGNAAYVPAGITTDERGLPRIVNGEVDTGAVEVQSVSASDVWTGAISNAWNTPGNWSGGATPGSATTAVFNSGNVVASSVFSVGSLVLRGGATLHLGAGSGGSSVTSLGVTGSWALEISNSHFLINYGSNPDPITIIAGYVKSGYNGGGWNGPGIISVAARTATNGLYYGLGYADGADKVVSALSSGQIEIKYTLLGDANLDGLVNGSDFNILAANFNQSITGWDQGDFNYDGLVNAADFNDLSANFNQGVSGASVASSAAVVAAPAAPTPKSKPFSVSKAVSGDTTSKKPKASAATAYAGSVVSSTGSTVTSSNINKDAKFLADR
jgi:hypothetical protein